MKKIVLTMALLISSVFGYNYNGTWTNTSPASYNDPIQLKITNTTITPFIKRGSKVARLKSKKATNTGSGLYEAWGFRDKNLAIFIKPINSYKIKVYLKKINTTQRKIVTKTFIFSNKKRVYNKRTKKRYEGSWVNSSPFSAISRLNIKQRNGSIIIKAWRPRGGGEEYLGAAKARVKNGRLYIDWKKRNLVVKANITGLNLNRNTNRFNKLRLNLTAYNRRNGISNSQTIYLRRANRLPVIGRPIIKTLKVGPIDINMMIQSY
jgi:hypothetical protein